MCCKIFFPFCGAAGEWFHIQWGEQTETFTHYVHLVGRTQCHRSLHATNRYYFLLCCVYSSFICGRSTFCVFIMYSEVGSDIIDVTIFVVRYLGSCTTFDWLNNVNLQRNLFVNYYSCYSPCLSLIIIGINIVKKYWDVLSLWMAF